MKPNGFCKGKLQTPDNPLRVQVQSNRNSGRSRGRLNATADTTSLPKTCEACTGQRRETLRVVSLSSNGTGQPAFMGRRQVAAVAVVILVALSFRRIKARGSVNAKGRVHLSRVFASANVKETACVSHAARPAIHAVSLAARFSELECRLTTRIRCSCLKRSPNQRCSLGKWQHDQPILHALGLLLADGWLKICPLSASRISRP
jgi:hypothetical protein